MIFTEKLKTALPNLTKDWKGKKLCWKNLLHNLSFLKKILIKKHLKKIKIYLIHK
jgi:hypothetical protein